MPPKIQTRTYDPVILTFMSIFMATTLGLVGYVYNDSRSQAIEYRKENKAMLMTLNNRLVANERDVAIIKASLRLAQNNPTNQITTP